MRPTQDGDCQDQRTEPLSNTSQPKSEDVEQEEAPPTTYIKNPSPPEVDLVSAPSGPVQDMQPELPQTVKETRQTPTAEHQQATRLFQTKVESTSNPNELNKQAQTPQTQAENSSQGTAVPESQTQTSNQATQTNSDEAESDDELSPADTNVMDEFKREVEFQDGKYFVKIPFYSTVEDVPDNFEQAKVMVDRVHRSLTHKNLAQKYTDVFNQQLEDGIIEEVDLTDDRKRVFIPHHPVIKMDEQTTTKIRPVFNCSFKTGTAPSLNEACFPGVNLLTSMTSLLHRFRTNDFMLMADIEKAFLQIYLKYDSDKDHFCFLWKTDDGMKAYRFRTLLFGLNASPFILNYIIQLHLQQQQETEVTAILRQSLYVDNFLYTSSDIQKLMYIYEESIKILQDGGFNLRSWKSNHPTMLSTMERDQTLLQHSASSEKILGYLYNPSEDSMALGGFQFEDQSGLTKRQLLSNINRVFDPLSLALPVTIRGRILMKQVWLEGTDWDQQVSPEVKMKWKALQQDLLALQSLSFPRKTVDLERDVPVTLHVFCDGSRTCYGVAGYLEQENRTTLVYSHSKLAPEKKSIPQTELLAVLQALDCVTTITTSLDIKPEQVFIWCDAQVVLEWLHTGAKTKSRFTINRLKSASEKKTALEAHLGCDVTFKYVSTQDNVADKVTRGISFKEFKRDMADWISGPSWLANQLSWPQNTLRCLSEMTKQTMQVNTRVTEQQVQRDDPEQAPVLDPEKFSSLRRLYGVTSRVFDFINRLKHRQADSHKQAEDYWIRYMQRTSYLDELYFLQNVNDDKTKKPPKYVSDLNLFLDRNGIIRCKGRLSKLNYYSYATLNPVLMGKSHALTTLMVREQHLRCKHMGIGTTLTALRERGFWIPAGRQVVKRVLKDCVTCKKFNSLAYSYPKLTDLPKERVRLLKPYQDTAIDYTGHIYVKEDSGEMKKVYIVVYTCLAIRAVHLDVVPDLTVKSFIQSFSRFCSTYQVPESLYTDNASYFVASKKIIENFFVSDDFKEHLQSHNIAHKTIPAYASWVGGVYERQVKTIKQCLHKTVGRSKLTYFELITHLAAIQDIVNGRPITYVNSELDDVEPLTPNKILKSHTNPRLRLVHDCDDGDPLWTQHPNDLHEQLNRTIQKQEQLLEKYINMWYSMYLLSLRETSRDVYQADFVDRISVGDIVLVDTKDKPRVYWQMGRVIQLIHGNDGHVRQVVLKTATGEGRFSTRKLHPLEIHA